MEDGAPVGGNGQEGERANDIGHARPEEALDNCRLKKNELENNGGRAEERSRQYDVAERPPRQPDVGNENGPDDHQQECGDERGRKVLIEQKECEVERDDGGYRADDGHGIGCVALLERGVEKEDGGEEGERCEE